MIRVWITRYALSHGIFDKVVEECGAAGMVRVVGSSPPIYYHGEDRDWHRTREGAIAKAEDTRRRKLATLKKQIAAIERLDFAKAAPP